MPPFILKSRPFHPMARGAGAGFDVCSCLWLIGRLNDPFAGRSVNRAADLTT